MRADRSDPPQEGARSCCQRTAPAKIPGCTVVWFGGALAGAPPVLVVPAALGACVLGVWVCALAGADVMGNRNRSRRVGGWVGGVFGLWGLLVLWLLPKKQAEQPVQPFLVEASE